jgi:hypothetical protein
MFRFLPALIGLGLATLWVVGLAVDATVWLTWSVGAIAPLCVATVGLVPARRGSVLAALCLLALSAAELGLWMVGLGWAATPWLTWWTFVGAGATAGAATAVATQGILDDFRTREMI